MTANQTSPSPHAAGLMQAGMAALQSGDIDGALLRFAAARRMTPGDIGLLRTLAALYQHAGRAAEAWSAAETGQALLPADPGFAAARIAALGSAGFTDAALTLARLQLQGPAGGAALLGHYGSRRLRPGGAAGALSRAWIERADGRIEALGAKAQFEWQAGDRLHVETAGAGGWGESE